MGADAIRCNNCSLESWPTCVCPSETREERRVDRKGPAESTASNTRVLHGPPRVPSFSIRTTCTTSRLCMYVSGMAKVATRGMAKITACQRPCSASWTRVTSKSATLPSPTALLFRARSVQPLKLYFRARYPV